MLFEKFLNSISMYCRKFEKKLKRRPLRPSTTSKTHRSKASQNKASNHFCNYLEGAQFINTGMQNEIIIIEGIILDACGKRSVGTTNASMTLCYCEA